MAASGAMARWVASAALAAGALVTGSRSTATTDTAKASGEDEYDVYVRHPRVEDLKILVERFEKGGQDVWPWVWTWRNANGPHHVYLGLTRDCVGDIERLSRENNNVLIIASERECSRVATAEQLASWQCGVIDGKIKLLDVENKMLMLADERIICFDRLIIAHDPASESEG